ncbi:pyridoxal phosphate-dependent decarboxylase family protein [Devosia sp.]|uniref:pyridoxal phosphate-dependent decarboxylase family protein n=1 Tax=Devosia sp. TaxID=1871048 RepID=UPI003A911812
MTTDPKALFETAMLAALDYRQSVADAPARPDRSYHDILATLDEGMPQSGTAPETALDELLSTADGGLMPITGPRFFGWVMGGSHPTGVAADWLVSAWGQNAGYHTPTPAVSAIEDQAERWLVELLDLPTGSSVGFATGATVANGTCLAAARTGVLLKAGWDADADGLFGAPQVDVFIGADAHSSLFSSLQLIGFGYRRVITIATDSEGRMIPSALEAAMAGRDNPAIVIAQAGQINTGAFDPFAEIAAIAKPRGAWLHVDGAFGLWARVSPHELHLTEGIELFDSWCTDGHKWLQVPYDCGFAIVRDREVAQRAMTQWSSYLPIIQQGDRVPSAFVPELSRRARGVPVWTVLKVLGREGVSELVAGHCALARRFADRLASEAGVRILNDVVLNQIAVSFGSGDAAARKAQTEAVIEKVQADGVCYAGGAQWRDDWIMRLSVTSMATTEADIDRSAEAIVAIWRRIRDAGGR